MKLYSCGVGSIDRLNFEFFEDHLLTGQNLVCVIGGVAENRTTIYSDISILIVMKGGRIEDERKRPHIETLEKAINVHGLPWGAP